MGRLAVVADEADDARVSMVTSAVLLPACCALASFWKYFWACVRIWTTVRVLIICAICFQPLPCSRMPSRKILCSSVVQRPVFSLAGGGEGVREADALDAASE